MSSIHWLNEAGVAEPQPVCTVDFADDAMAVDFAHNLYRAVHAFARSKPGFAIQSEGRALYAWRCDDGPVDLPPAEDAVASKSGGPDAELPVLGATATAERPSEAAGPSRLVLSSPRHRPFVRLRAALRVFAGPRRRKPRQVSPTSHAGLRHLAPDAAFKVKGWRPELDHYLLAIIAVLAVLCGSPLCSIYVTVQSLLKDDTVLRQERSVALRATRDATRSVVATDGKLDFRKLFWHLRLVAPTEIHLLAYEPRDGLGPRLIFETKDGLRWHLRRVQGADGTWWAGSAPTQHRG